MSVSELTTKTCATTTTADPGYAQNHVSVQMGRLGTALHSRNADQRRIAERGLDFIVTLLQKNSDYGSSVWKTPTLCPDLDCGSAILVRMGDKIERIASLRTKSPEVVDESLTDTIKDLGAYCLLWLARPQPATQEDIRRVKEIGKQLEQVALDLAGIDAAEQGISPQTALLKELERQLADVKAELAVAGQTVPTSMRLAEKINGLIHQQGRLEERIAKLKAEIHEQQTPIVAPHPQG